MNIHGTANTAFGSKALYANNTGFENTATGYQSLHNNTSGYQNTANGFKALEANTTGERNTAIGTDALNNNNTGGFNTACGSGALDENISGDLNTACGVDALRYNITGYYNTAIGVYALGGNELGFFNTGIGAGTMGSNFAGSHGTAVGYRAMLFSNPTATPHTNYNVAVGYEALRGTYVGNNTGNYNTATGYTSLWSIYTGNYNTANGYRALYTTSTGNFNTATGNQALESNTSGSGNTGFGTSSILSNATGSNNSGFGRGAYFPNNGLDNTTCIGYNSGGNVNASNHIEIGNTSVSWIGGQQTWSTYSDGRIKDNIAADVPGLDFITLLRPVTYNLNIHRQNEMVYAGRKEEEEWPSKYDVEQMRTTGFIAQEVAQAANEVGYDFSGVEIPKDPNELYSLRYSDFVVPLVKGMQEQQVLIEDQQEIIQELRIQLDEVLKELQIIKNQLSSKS
jgi:trimeric autotransporter adhesin